jgi:glycosyltransferase involved in cell wall biosynthesis
MKFCMITTFYPPYGFGGDANFVQNLTLQLAARGHTVDVVHCRDSYRTLGGHAPTQIGENPPNVTVHGLESRWSSLSPVATHQTGRPFFKAKQIKRVLEKPFDVIHYHNISLVGGPKVLQYGKGIKLYTWHEYWLVCPTNLLMRDGREPCIEKRCTSCTLHQGRPPQWWRATDLLTRSLENIDAFLSPSRFGIAQHGELGLKQPVVHLPTFVDSLEPVPRGTSTEPYFLYAGRLEYAKGVGTLIEPFLKWNKARLIIAGAGAEDRRLRDAADSSDRIQFLGHVPIAKLRELYRNAVAVIVPSLTYELFPLVILEAFREGTPVIVRNRGSMPEPVLDSGGGLMYDSNEELMAHADHLLADSVLRDELGARGMQAVNTLWSAETHMRRYLDLIQELGMARRTGA